MTAVCQDCAQSQLLWLSGKTEVKVTLYTRITCLLAALRLLPVPPAIPFKKNSVTRKSITLGSCHEFKLFIAVTHPLDNINLL